MALLEEIEDVSELKHLSEVLDNKIKKQTSFRTKKTVGYPSGREDRFVHFVKRKGAEVFWWSSRVSHNSQAVVNLIGRGDPDGEAYLLIDLQFNIPIARFARKHGGAFVRDLESGAILLAHRGIVTRGKSRVEKAELFAETNATVAMASSSRGISQLFIVASLESDTLLEDVSTFALEVRRAAEVIKGNSDQQRKEIILDSSFDETIGDYFDEFAGKRPIPSREAGKALVAHGYVVKQLAELFEHSGELRKSKLVDLALIRKNKILLFEVKTSASLQSLYTAIGQLSVHAIALRAQFPRHTVKSILISPQIRNQRIVAALKDDLEIELVTFTWKTNTRVIFASFENVLNVGT